MNFNGANLTKFRKINFFLLLIFLLIFVVLGDFFLKSLINVSSFYKFKHFKMKLDGVSKALPNTNVFLQDTILKLDPNKYYYHVLNEHLISFSDYHYVLSSFKDNYSVFSRETDKFLFSFKSKDFVFAKGNAIFALNDLYKALEVYGMGGDKILSLKFIASILSIDYNDDVLALGLSNGKTYVYKGGNMIYGGDLLSAGLPVICVKLSLDNKYLCIVREDEANCLEVINLDDRYNQILHLKNLKFRNFNPFLKVDGFYNLFLETKDSFLMLNIQDGKIFRVDNENSVLRASYDAFSRVYRIYFYDIDDKIINVRTYSLDSFKLFDNIFFKDTINSYIEFNEGILYFNDNSELKYLGL
ncbi:hypothetical protein CR532_01590 [Candidatus Borreliella tachyglossi]|uniref:DUF5050 domain-containing protein n=1 Tax=Candidatus Borreliella tachyglossi TaxID=1964448 RepID=A0A2S1LWM6_9SPIR|nr:hypothetical protein [Candidatus Borreliella tachyglossi]AWG42694.1 hypothetical protein CR532_01590 [Candidatus Borreliella tachyglossi]